MASPTSIGNRIAPSRFLLFFALLSIGWAAGISLFGTERGLLAGFDLAAIGFLLSCIPLFGKRASDMRKIAADNDANRHILLALSIALSAVVLAAITAQIVNRAALGGFDKLLIALTLVLVWTFANAVYTLHYAHLFYMPNDKGEDSRGLIFPGDSGPHLADFVYFAFTLGVAVQTADVVVTSPHVRRVVTVHCVAGFFFNLGVLALSINVLGAG
ncbi:MAG TPA: DUF1345 domain-containing protein [Sphingomicrobium sp.]|nr:DUF1345 domain-containing protein [Sphingomicrobium sp.]